MKKLRIGYLFSRPKWPEGEPHDQVRVYLRISRNSVNITIVRRGFVIADHVMQAIEKRIRKLVITDGRPKPLAESIGLHLVVNDEWRTFFEDLLQRQDSWVFLIPTAGVCSAS